MVEDTSGHIWKVRVIGENGRISYSQSSHRDGGEVRVYRTAAAKHYDAVLPNVKRIWSHNVLIEDAGRAKDVLDEEAALKKEREEMFEKTIKTIVSKAASGGYEEDDEGFPKVAW